MQFYRTGRQALLTDVFPTPRGRLRLGAMLLLVAVGISTFFHLRPALGSGTWWLGVSAILLGLIVPLLDWRRMPLLAALPLVIATDLFASGIVLLNPGHPEVTMIFVLTSAFVSALFHGAIVVTHLALLAATLIWYLQLGGEVSTVWNVSLTVLVITGFLRTLGRGLRSQKAQLRTLRSLAELLPVLKAHGVHEVIEAAVRQLVKVTESDSGIVAVLDPQGENLRPFFLYFERPVAQETEEAWKAMAIPVGQGITGWVAAHRLSIMAGDAERHPMARHVPGTPTIDESLIVVPLMTNGQLYGVLRIQKNGIDQYTADDLRLLELMAAHVSDALSRADLEQRISRRDALTGCYNRQFLAEWASSLLPSDEAVSLLVCDCRGLREVNARWGYREGDRILQAAAQSITEVVGTNDLVVRYAGDAFLVVLPGAGQKEAGHAADQIRERLWAWNAAQPADSPQIHLEISSDTATAAEWEALLDRADIQIYASSQVS